MRDEHHVEALQRLLGLGHQRSVPRELAEVRAPLEDDLRPRAPQGPPATADRCSRDRATSASRAPSAA